VEQAQRVVAAGVRFVVSPGFDPEIVDWCLRQGVPVMPGVATPTEITAALKKGLRILKFFPAEQLGGVRMLKALADPFGGVNFVPTGGINPSNLAEYLSLPNVHACGGSWMVPAKVLAQQQFGEIRRLVVEALSLVQQARQGSTP
jgi:2-dehydro-3-deoxyphosphogluconate aldolase/(4S)-4-hydroxy-2-oxoglutarate aldolase